jgi:hypothetical protein
MSNNHIHHLSPLIQEFELQLQTLDNLIFELYIKNGHLREAWRQIVIAQGKSSI